MFKFEVYIRTFFLVEFVQRYPNMHCCMVETAAAIPNVYS